MTVTRVEIRPVYYSEAEVRGVTDVWVESSGVHYYSRVNYVAHDSPGMRAYFASQFEQRQRVYSTREDTA